MKIRPVAAELFHAYGQTNMTKLKVPSHNFTNALQHYTNIVSNFIRQLSLLTNRSQPTDWVPHGTYCDKATRSGNRELSNKIMTLCIVVCVLLFQKCTWWCGYIAERVCVQATKIIQCLRKAYIKHTMSRCKEHYI